MYFTGLIRHRPCLRLVPVAILSAINPGVLTAQAPVEVEQPTAQADCSGASFARTGSRGARSKERPAVLARGWEPSPASLAPC
jgi:hypothetical protein